MDCRAHRSADLTRWRPSGLSSVGAGTAQPDLRGVQWLLYGSVSYTGQVLAYLLENNVGYLLFEDGSRITSG